MLYVIISVAITISFVITYFIIISYDIYVNFKSLLINYFYDYYRPKKLFKLFSNPSYLLSLM